jgi:hypothetical protein
MRQEQPDHRMHSRKVCSRVSELNDLEDVGIFLAAMF